jgi:hypothetical protein
MSIQNLSICGFLAERRQDIRLCTQFSANTAKESPIDNDLQRKRKASAIRRRTGSYNAYKIPRVSKIRKMSNCPLLSTSDAKSRCRQHKRRLLSIISNRKTTLRLRTHVWHAKRMKMCNMWGYRLATTHSNRGFKSVDEFMKSRSIVHDQSYIRPIVLKGYLDALLSLVEPYTVSDTVLYSAAILCLKCIRICAIAEYK